MPNYVNKALDRFQHPTPKKPQHSSQPYTTPIYGQKQQYAKSTGNACQLTPAQVNFYQEFTGILKYYSSAIENTTQAAIRFIASSISTRSWKDIKLRINQFLDYSATYTNNHIQYKASQMHLWLHSDYFYLNETKARSRNGGYFYLVGK